MAGPFHGKSANRPAVAVMLITMGTLRLAAVLVLAQAAHAQPAADASSVVHDVAAAALAAKSWRAEGKLVRSDEGKSKPPVTFRIAFSPPRYARLEIEGGDTPLLRICDGGA